jgi:MoaA/NifB/PqqE/SkfB family radical SAM enzyme
LETAVETEAAVKRNARLALGSWERHETAPDTLPAVLYLESVKGCPYTCAMCRTRGTKTSAMDRDLLARVEPYFPGLEVLAIHGNGEPLLGDLEYFVEQATRHGFVLHMNTTGFFLSRRVARLLASASLSVRFSIHAGTRETYRKIMGQDLDRVISNIELLLEATAHKEHDFWFSYIVMRENVDEIPEFLEMAHRLGIRSVRFMRLLPNRESLAGIRLKDRDFTFRYAKQYNSGVVQTFLSRLPGIRRRAEELGIRVEAGTVTALGGTAGQVARLADIAAMRFLGRHVLPLGGQPGDCAAPWLGQLQVWQDGSVVMCCRTAARLGNIRESGLDELWRSRVLNAVRTSIARGRIPSLCGYCMGIGLSEYPRISFDEARPYGVTGSPVATSSMPRYHRR